MFKYMILFACIAIAAARPGPAELIAAPGTTLYSALPSAPLSPVPLTYAAGPIAASYYNPLAYAAPYPYYPYTAYDFKAPFAYSALPAATIIQ